MADFITQLIALAAAHAWAGVGGLFMALFVTLLTDRAQFMKSWDSPWRTVIGTLFGAAGMVFDMFGKGSVTSAAILSVVATVLPTLIAEITAATQGKMAAAKAAQRGQGHFRALAALTLGVLGWCAVCAFAHGCNEQQQAKVASVVGTVETTAHQICTAMGMTDAQCVQSVIEAVKNANMRALQRNLDGGSVSSSDSSFPAVH